MEYVMIGMGGFLGANVRYLVANWAAQRFGVSFPYGTFFINISGSFINIFGSMLVGLFGVLLGFVLGGLV